jgi:hypothetical protein
VIGGARFLNDVKGALQERLGVVVSTLGKV